MTTLKDKALSYHQHPHPGKLGTSITKPTQTQEDLALAYSPGVAEPVLEIAHDPANAYKYTNKGNLVAVISNGSAILGLGNRGALASKPVMEGKGVLFKKFADIDVFDIEMDTPSPDAMIEAVTAIAPTFGGINLEDIKAPDCFIIEDALKERLDIPVFHDDQHGTAITIAAALKNALNIHGKKIEKIKLVMLGAGASALATANLLVKMGMDKSQITLLDSRGVVYAGRENVNPYKAPYAHDTDMRTLLDACKGADVLIGLSGIVIENPEDIIQAMDAKGIYFMLSNPTPEIQPELIQKLNPEAIFATGRSDYPNQVNNVLCFPYIFRGALDAKAKTITTKMQIAAVDALVEATMLPETEELRSLYPHEDELTLGPNYILPKPLDSRLKNIIPKAVMDASQ